VNAIAREHLLQFNGRHHRKTEIDVIGRLLKDANLLGDAAGVGLFSQQPATISWSAS